MTTTHLPTGPTTLRRLVGVLAVTGALGLTSCAVLPDRADTDSSAGAGDTTESESGSPESGTGDPERTTDADTQQDDPDQQVLGSSTGQHVASVDDSTSVPLRLDVLAAERVDGDVVEVRFTITNTGTGVGYEPWRTLAEPEGGYDVSGAALLDLPDDKRYLVLLDSEGACLCSDFPSASAVIEAGESLDLYAQFPAPPAGTAAVDLSVPGFAPVAGLEIG
jgi:hypothetical protein